MTQEMTAEEWRAWWDSILTDETPDLTLPVPFVWYRYDGLWRPRPDWEHQPWRFPGGVRRVSNGVWEAYLNSGPMLDIVTVIGRGTQEETEEIYSNAGPMLAKIKASLVNCNCRDLETAEFCPTHRAKEALLQK